MTTSANLSSAEISSQMYLAKLPNPTNAMVWHFVVVVDDAITINGKQSGLRREDKIENTTRKGSLTRRENPCMMT